MIKFKTSATKELGDIKQSLRQVEKSMPKAFYSALNRVSQGLRTEAARKTRETYDIRAGDVRNTITFSKSGSLDFIMKSRGPNIPLIRFKTKPSKVPVRPPKVLKASVKRSGGKPIPGAFVARMKTGHVGVYIRSGKERLPVGQLYGPAVPVMMSSPEVSEHLQEQAAIRMQKRLDHEVNRVLGRLNIK